MPPGGASARDRVGIVSLAIVRRCSCCSSCWPRVGLVGARLAEARSACRTRRRPSSAPAPRPRRPARSRCRRARTSTSRRSTRSRRATRNGTSAPPSSRPRRRQGRDAAVRRRPARPRRAGQGDQGHRRSRSSSACWRRWSRPLIGTLLGAARRLLRRQGRRLPRVALQRLHRDPGHPADLRVRGGVRARHRHGGADPRPHRLDRHVPPGARRVHQARAARVRALGRGDRRLHRSRMFRHILPNVSHVILVRCRCWWSASSRPR